MSPLIDYNSPFIGQRCLNIVVTFDNGIFRFKITNKKTKCLYALYMDGTHYGKTHTFKLTGSIVKYPCWVTVRNIDIENNNQ